MPVEPQNYYARQFSSSRGARQNQIAFGGSITFERKIEERFLKTVRLARAYKGFDGMIVALRNVEEHVFPNGALTGVHRLAAMMEKWAKENHPWRDRTGHTTRMLNAYAGTTGQGKYFAAIRHGVPWGIWLEIRYNGKWGVIEKTQQAFAPRVQGILKSEIELELDGRGSQFRHKETGRFA